MNQNFGYQDLTNYTQYQISWKVETHQPVVHNLVERFFQPHSHIYMFSIECDLKQT